RPLDLPNELGDEQPLLVAGERGERCACRTYTPLVISLVAKQLVDDSHDRTTGMATFCSMKTSGFGREYRTASRSYGVLDHVNRADGCGCYEAKTRCLQSPDAAYKVWREDGFRGKAPWTIRRCAFLLHPRQRSLLVRHLVTLPADIACVLVPSSSTGLRQSRLDLQTFGDCTYRLGSCVSRLPALPTCCNCQPGDEQRRYDDDEASQKKAQCLENDVVEPCTDAHARCRNDSVSGHRRRRSGDTIGCEHYAVFLASQKRTPSFLTHSTKSPSCSPRTPRRRPSADSTMNFSSSRRATDRGGRRKDPLSSAAVTMIRSCHGGFLSTKGGARGSGHAGPCLMPLAILAIISDVSSPPSAEDMPACMPQLWQAMR